ncbi:MAG: PAS domain S-box protein [Candidatus Latescibacteria bacterium]|nr:PAS domain S-box protein [Candidatus Latescibacterota bacterium]
MKDQDKTRAQLLDELAQLRRQIATSSHESNHDPGDLSRLASFPEQNPDPVLEIDDHSSITYINPIARKRFPQLPAAGLDHPFFAGLEDTVNQLRQGTVLAYAREHQVAPFIYDQKVTWLPDSRLIRIYAHDITERKQTEEALHQSERKYRGIIENLAGEFYFFTQDMDENTTFIGPSGAEMTGYTQEEFDQLEHHALVPDTPLNREATQHRERLYSGQRPPPYQFEMRHKDGTLHRYEIIRTPVFNDNRQVSGSEGMVRDITASHRAAEELQQANEAAQQAQQQLIEQLEEKLQTAEKLRQIQQQLITQEKMASLGKLVAGVAHEINNPSGVLISALDLIDRCANRMADRIERAPSLEALHNDRQLQKTQALLGTTTDNATQASRRIAHLVKSLRNFAHLDEAEYQVVDISLGLESALALLEPHLPEGVQVDRDLKPLAPTYCAPAQLNQVFMHLLQNARQALTGPGRIELTAYQRDNSIYVRIADTGVGIPPAQLEKIFDFDFNSDQARVKKGFGLFIDFNIVKDHGGEIAIDSQVGEGTVVTVRLLVRMGPDSADAMAD